MQCLGMHTQHLISNHCAMHIESDNRRMKHVHSNFHRHASSSSSACWVRGSCSCGPPGARQMRMATVEDLQAAPTPNPGAPYQGLLLHVRVPATRGPGPLRPSVSRRVSKRSLGPLGPRVSLWFPRGSLVRSAILLAGLFEVSRCQRDLKAILGRPARRPWCQDPAQDRGPEGREEPCSRHPDLQDYCIPRKGLFSVTKAGVEGRSMILIDKNMYAPPL